MRDAPQNGASVALNRRPTLQVFRLLELLLLPWVAAAGQTNPLPTIVWHGSTLRLVQEGGDYGRMARFADGAIGCAYDRGRRMCLRRSVDEGKTWSEPLLIAEDLDCWLTNAELLVLRDRTVLYLWNERPLAAVKAHSQPAPSTALTRPFLIRMARSTDNGHTWSKPQTLYAGGSLFEDGCWEPAGVQLASGEVQVYFSDESPFTKTAEQEIALLRSPDGGRTWSQRQRVAFRAGHRDGMPSPLVLANGRGIAVAVEDDGYVEGPFKPSIFHTSMQDNWQSGVASGDSTNRWPALKEPLPREWYAGAPCLRQLPSGETLLSFQESSDGKMRRCRMAVCVGDADARGFTDKTYPIPLGPRGNQVWNSLFIKDPRTVVAVSTANVNGVKGIWCVEGTVTRR